MLAHVSVKDILLLENADLELQDGLTVLTGGTGAGKSILVEALLLLLGARASAEAVRQGASEGSVQAQLVLTGEDAKRTARLLEHNGLPPLEDGALVLRRVISKEGRHKQLVNGALVTVAQMKSLAEPLVDFTGQHAHQALLRAGAQLELLDAFAENDTLLVKMHAAHDVLRTAEREHADLAAREADKERRLDLVRFYLDEIEALAPEAGEDEKLENEHKRLKNSARLAQNLEEAGAVLADDVSSRLHAAVQALARAAADDDAVRPLKVQLEEGLAIVDDVARSLARGARVEADPQRLAQLEDRLDALKKLMRKHNGDVARVLQVKAELVAERDSLDHAGARLTELTAQISKARTEASAIADKLSAKRRASGKKLAAAIEAELPQLGMSGARCELHVDVGDLSARGADRVELYLAANPGEPAAPLAKVASGGELSRVLLAIKRVLLEKDPVPTSIFDEVDAGVGGAVADAIGEKLQAIALGASIAGKGASGRRQVLCISHLPQIAARADQHLVVEKAVVSGRSVSRVRTLDDDQRVEELARMLGGKTVTEATRRHAEEMLSRARGTPPKKKKRA